MKFNSLPFLLLIADAVSGGDSKVTTPPAKPETAQETIQRLKAELDAANGKLADFAKIEAARIEFEKKVAERTSKGLTRQQAIAVIQRQEAHDAALEAEWSKRRAIVVKAIKANPDDDVAARVAAQKALRVSISAEEIEAAKKTLAA